MTASFVTDVTTKPKPVRFDLIHELEGWTPKSNLGLTIWRALPFLPHDLAAELVERIRSAAVMESVLYGTVLRGYGLFRRGLIPLQEVKVEYYGVLSRRVVTDVGVGFIVDAFQNIVELETMKYHGLGTGTTAEAAAQTALVTELTTEYTGNVRATGTTTEASAPVYQTVATNTMDSGTPAVTEHSVFSAAAVGVMLDRSVFAALNLVGANGDALTTDYRLSFVSGG